MRREPNYLIQQENTKYIEEKTKVSTSYSQVKASAKLTFSAWL